MQSNGAMTPSSEMAREPYSTHTTSAPFPHVQSPPHGRCSVLAMGAAGFRELCLACRRGLEAGIEDVYLPPLGLLETMVLVLPERAKGQEGHLAAVFVAAKVRKKGLSF